MTTNPVAGDLVRLTPRERPHYDQTVWWWRVTQVDAAGLLDVIRVAGRSDTRRRGVSPACVLEVKKGDEW